MPDKKFYITTTIPYVNAPPHIGHAFEFVQSDAIARYRRANGDEVYFLSGADENAIKNVRAAEAAGISVQKFVDQNTEAFRSLLGVLNISIDQFIRTTEMRHKEGAQALWRATKNDIYEKEYRGLYCVGCELFYRKEELNEKGECEEHPGKKIEIVEEKNYFFRLSKYESWLKEVITQGNVRIVPEKWKNEVLSFIGQGLEDFSVSRPADRSNGWGVPVPGDESQRMYVWFDALSNYVTALGYPDTDAELYKRYWGSDGVRLHVLGKGVSRFHAIYWLAMLKSAGLPLPTNELIHGYVTTYGAKMSKTVGNVVDPSELVKKYGVDAVRYFLLREIPTMDDGDFSEEKFRLRYNADLANGLGNFTARVLALAERDANIPMPADKEVIAEIEKTKEIIAKKIDEFKLHEAVAAVWGLITFGDRYLNETAPWKMEDEKKRAEVVGSLLLVLEAVGGFVEPFLPAAGEKIKNAVVHEGDTFRTEKIALLFPRLEKGI